MRDIKVKVHPSKSNLKKEDQLAWKIAEIASDKARIDKDAVDIDLLAKEYEIDKEYSRYSKFSWDRYKI